MIWSIAFSPNGKHIISGSKDKMIRVWDAETGEAAEALSRRNVGSRRAVGEPFRGHTEAVYSVAFSSDGKRIVSGSTDKTVRAWDAETGAAIGVPLLGHTNLIKCVAFSPDGKRIASCSTDTTIRVWNSQKGESVSRPDL